MAKEGQERGEAAVTVRPEAGTGERGTAHGGTAAGEAGAAGAAEAGMAGGEAGAGEVDVVDGGTGAGEVGTAGGGIVGEEAGEAATTAPGTPAAALDDELAAAQREARENLDRALRAQAELENVRRRAERDLAQAHKFALERFVSELLPVKDSLELGLTASAGEEAGAAGIVEGVELTLRMLEQVMDKFGVKALDPAGEPFNPGFHQAMTMQESDTVESGTVLTVVQKGYLLNERLVRPAMVIVAK